MRPREWNFDIYAYFSKKEKGNYQELQFNHVAIEKKIAKKNLKFFLQFFIIFHLILEK